MELKRSFENINNSQYNNLNFKEDQNNSFKLYKNYIAKYLIYR